MSDVTIQTPRGVTLSGTFTRPVDCRDAAVIFSHSFLSDRHASGLFDAQGRALRAAGYASLTFDYSGHGSSGDEILSVEPLIQDFRAASGWLADQGFTRQVVLAHEFGAPIALRAHPSAVATYVLISPVLGPLTYDWDVVFSSVQLTDLERHGTTTIPDDSPSARRHFTISKHTLADMSMVDAHQLFTGIDTPILITHDSFDEDTGLLDLTQEAFHLLPDGSAVEMTSQTHGNAEERPGSVLATDPRTHTPLADVILPWVKRWVPADPARTATR